MLSRKPFARPITATLYSDGGGYVVGGALGDAGIVSSGDTEIVSSGDSARDLQIVSGGELIVDAGGSVTLTSLAGGEQLLFGSGSETRISSGGVEDVQTGGFENGALVYKGGEIVLSSGGVAAGSVIHVGGEMTIAAGAVATGTVLSAGGTLLDNGTVDYYGPGTTILNGTLLGSGSIQQLYTPQTGYGQVVLSGNATAFTGDYVIDGGYLTIATASGVGGGSIVFAAPAYGSAFVEVDKADSA